MGLWWVHLLPHKPQAMKSQTTFVRVRVYLSVCLSLVLACFSVFYEWKELRTSARFWTIFSSLSNLPCHLDSVFDLYFNFFMCTFWTDRFGSSIWIELLPACQWSCGKVMFSVMCVCPQEVPCDHYPWSIATHLTATTPISWHVETCSNWTALGTPPLLSPSPPVQGAFARPLPIRLTSGWFTSYWKAFLFTVMLQAVAHLIGIT